MNSRLKMLCAMHDPRAFFYPLPSIGNLKLFIKRKSHAAATECANEKNASSRFWPDTSSGWRKKSEKHPRKA
jgi:hypothetical protein